MTTRTDCCALDAADALAPLRELFALPRGRVYLDGNSLGPLPKAALGRLSRVAAHEWAEGLIASWNDARWIDLPRVAGDKVGRVVGAGPGEVVVADSTSVNLHKALGAALDLTSERAPQRRVILTERHNFPTDLYIAGSLARERGPTLRRADDVLAALGGDVAVVTLTQVDYRTGRLTAMAPVNRAAHEAGALTVWDLSHSAGVVPIALHGGAAAEACDFAVGCGYKYLNGGPGAPAYLWVHPRHLAHMQEAGTPPPLPGWLGHADPFAFSEDYRPAPGIARFQCGTPPILSLAAMECGVDTVLAAAPFGGMPALRRKSQALTELFIALVDARCAGLGLTLRTPRDPQLRGSQVSYAFEGDGYAVMQALIERGVVGDFRAPDLLRFGFSPLFNRHTDAYDACKTLRAVLEGGAWRTPCPRGRVT
ncbi:MAG TPA: kynureninase [Casimicrobiaceae bacterium]|nr:kynureninase [Casimicrobiaceae bacterium]